MDVTLRTKPAREREPSFYHRLFMEEIKIKIDGEVFLQIDRVLRKAPPSPKLLRILRRSLGLPGKLLAQFRRFFEHSFFCFSPDFCLLYSVLDYLIGQITKIAGSQSMWEMSTGRMLPVSQYKPPQNAPQVKAAKISTGFPVGR